MVSGFRQFAARTVAALAAAVVSALSLAATPAEADAQVLLRMSAEEGAEERYAVTMAITVSAPAMGQDMTIDMDMYTTAVFESVDEDSYVQAVTIDSMFASNAPGVDIPDMTGETFVVRFDYLGNVVEVLEVPEGIEGVEVFESSIRGGSYSLPESEVSIGDSWIGESEFQLPFPGAGDSPIVIDRVFELLAVEDGLAEYSEEGEVNSIISLGGGMEATITGTASGAHTFDVAGGYLTIGEVVNELAIALPAGDVFITIATVTERIQ
ncbi:MAG: hypothetical protein J4G03_06330 [Gemmatimonadetes bacterium]|nr:hypothetical protein [Gemmatimonadota bacterium]